MNDGMQWYGNWAALTEEPTQEVYDKCVEALKKSISDNKNLEIAWETMVIVYKTPDDLMSPFDTYFYPEADEYEEEKKLDGKEPDEEKEPMRMWTIGIKVKAKERNNG